MKYALVQIISIAATIAGTSALAAEKKTEAPKELAAQGPSTEGDGAEKVNVESIKEKYWARGDESELGVVQNRLYSKEGKFKLSLFGGVITSDPFLNVQTIGGTLGYNFSEYLAVQAIAWKAYFGPSSALTTFQTLTGGTTNYNGPLSFFGVEGTGSILYGKLSLLGKKIVYFDLHGSLGAGATGTETGTYFTPFIGFGQQAYITKWMMVRMDYRVMYYRETIRERTVSPLAASYWSEKGQRDNWTHAISIGFDFLLGAGK